MWDPSQYAVFADLRARPFVELLARVGARDPRLVVDLGCGDGALTLELAQRWPSAEVVGVDSSPQMLARARDLDSRHRVRWLQQDIAGWRPDRPVGVLVTNAALQWVPGHRAMIPRFVEALEPGGWFAMQVPGNFDAPSHRLLREVAAASPRAAELAAVLRHEDVVAEPGDYAALLAGLGTAADVWETTYQQVLDPLGEQESPVLEWTRGTALRPVLAVLDGADRQDLLARYAAELALAYPREPYGTTFPFRRIFAVAQVPSTSQGAGA